MPKFDDDDYDVSNKNIAIAETIGFILGLVVGAIIGLVIGIAYVGGLWGSLLSMVTGLTTGSILGYVVAAVSTNSPSPRVGESEPSYPNPMNDELHEESYSSKMRPVLETTIVASNPAPAVSESQGLDLRKVRPPAPESNSFADDKTMHI